MLSETMNTLLKAREGSERTGSDAGPRTGTGGIEQAEHVHRRHSTPELEPLVNWSRMEVTRSILAERSLCSFSSTLSFSANCSALLATHFPGDWPGVKLEDLERDPRTALLLFRAEEGCLISEEDELVRGAKVVLLVTHGVMALLTP
uniref:Uncharacterized protein n=1 Tax=Cacopsylla melanoneura TaxID=428564 RepID=A0A8D9AKR0_9HEMI